MPTTAADIICNTCPTVLQGDWCDFTDAGCGIGSLWDNGMVVQNDIATELARGASLEAKVKDFDTRDLYAPADPYQNNPDEDHCADCIGPKEIEEVLRRQEFGKCFAENYTARWCQGCDDERAIDRVFSELNDIRQFQYEHRVMETLIGVYGSNLADDQSIITDLTTDPYGIGTTFSRLNSLKAMGDRDCEMIDAILVHPVVYTNKMCEGFVECPCEDDGSRASFLQGPNGERLFRAGKNIKDRLVLNGNYLSIGYQNGAIRYGEGCTTDPVNRFYNECEKTFYIDMNNRVVLHPCGFSWANDQVTVEGLADADLSHAANWNQVGNNPSFQFFVSTG